MNNISEMRYYGRRAMMFGYDIRYDTHNRAFFNPLPAGRVQFRLQTEPGFIEGALVYTSQHTSHALPLVCTMQDSRFLYWEVTADFSQLPTPQITYAFAFKRADGQLAYLGGKGATHVVETPFTLDLTTLQPFTTPEWVHGAVMYQIFPERFAPTDQIPPAWGTPPQWSDFQGGHLRGITRNLDYLKELGVEILYLNPINTSPSNHKYDAVDFLHVDPAFGGDTAFKELVQTAHGRGLKVVLDASFNHCYPQFFAFQDLVKQGENSAYKDWFTVHEFPVRVKIRPHTAEKLDERFWPWLEKFKELSGVPVEEVTDEGPLIEPTYEAWFGVINMPKINQSNPETRAYFLNVARHWLTEYEMDGWRMDVAQHVVDDFWDEFRQVCKETKPDCYLLAEIWGDTSPWLQGNQFDATMNYYFRDMCVRYFAQTELNTPPFMDGLIRMYQMYAPQVTAVTQNLFGSHDVARFKHLAGERSERLRLATLFKLTMPGVPSIYYGDEIGMSGGDDPDNRRAFPWHQRESWDLAMLAHTRELIYLRQQHPALKLGSWRPVWHSAEALAYERVHEQEHILIILTRQKELRQVALPYQAEHITILYGEGKVTPAGNSLIVQNLPAWSGLILKVGSGV